jgi:hypothetical protein
VAGSLSPESTFLKAQACCGPSLTKRAEGAQNGQSVDLDKNIVHVLLRLDRGACCCISWSHLRSSRRYLVNAMSRQYIVSNVMSFGSVVLARFGVNMVEKREDPDMKSG